MSEEKQENAHARAVKTYHQKRVEAGMQRIGIYIPRDRRNEFYARFNELRDKWAEEGYDV